MFWKQRAQSYMAILNRSVLKYKLLLTNSDISVELRAYRCPTNIIVLRRYHWETKYKCRPIRTPGIADIKLLVGLNACEHGDPWFERPELYPLSNLLALDRTKSVFHSSKVGKWVPDNTGANIGSWTMTVAPISPLVVGRTGGKTNINWVDGTSI